MSEKISAERAITLYNKALDGAELPEKIWKKIARVNAVLLNKK